MTDGVIFRAVDGFLAVLLMDCPNVDHKRQKNDCTGVTGKSSFRHCNRREIVDTIHFFWISALSVTTYAAACR